MTVTSTHGAPTLRALINVSVKRGIMGMDPDVQRKMKRLSSSKSTGLFYNECVDLLLYETLNGSWSGY